MQYDRCNGRVVAPASCPIGQGHLSVQEFVIILLKYRQFLWDQPLVSLGHRIAIPPLLQMRMETGCFTPLIGETKQNQTRPLSIHQKLRARITPGAKQVHMRSESWPQIAKEPHPGGRSHCASPQMHHLLSLTRHQARFRAGRESPIIIPYPPTILMRI